VGGTNRKEAGEKERVLTDVEYGNMLHVYALRQHNETHQTLFEKEGRRRRKIEM
jgi:hypothetical protein